MKVAHLPNGRVLPFPEGTPDEAIDETVRFHMHDAISEANEQKERWETERREKHENARRQMLKEQQEAEEKVRMRNEDAKRRNEDNIRREKEFRAKQANHTALTQLTSRNHSELLSAMNKHSSTLREEGIQDRQLHATLHQQRDMVLQGMAQQIHEMNVHLAVLSASMPSLVKSIEDMAKQVRKSGDAISKALLTPKELAFDSRGRPTHVKPKIDNSGTNDNMT